MLSLLGLLVPMGCQVPSLVCEARQVDTRVTAWTELGGEECGAGALSPELIQVEQVGAAPLLPGMGWRSSRWLQSKQSESRGCLGPQQLWLGQEHRAVGPSAATEPAFGTSEAPLHAVTRPIQTTCAGASG